MGDTHHRWSASAAGGGTITRGPTLADEQRRYHSSRDMIPPAAANTTTTAAAISSSDLSTRRQYHSTRDMQVRPTSLHDLRCYSASYASYGLPPLDLAPVPSSKSNGKAGYVPSSSFSTGGSYRWVDPEMQRRKRVAAYKAYGMEGKVKGSVKKGWRWVRERYRDIVHGWR